MLVSEIEEDISAEQIYDATSNAAGCNELRLVAKNTEL